jgi:hypothetical protein
MVGYLNWTSINRNWRPWSELKSFKTDMWWAAVHSLTNIQILQLEKNLLAPIKCSQANLSAVDPSGNVVQGVVLRLFACWDCGFESRRGIDVCLFLREGFCQLEVSASGWSLAQTSPTECGVSECDHEARKRRPWPEIGSKRQRKKYIYQLVRKLLTSQEETCSMDFVAPWLSNQPTTKIRLLPSLRL